jgi:hypothetical protein
MAIQYKEKNELERALRLLSLLQPYKVKKEKISENIKKNFLKELSNYSYYIPENLTAVEIPGKDKKRILNLILNCKLLLNIQRNSYLEILSMENSILEKIELDLDCIETATINSVILMYCENDYKRGMNLVIKIGRIFEKNNEFLKFSSIAKMILYPTIYEVTNNPSLSESSFKSLNKELQNPLTLFDQLELQRDVISLLWFFLF